MLKLNSIRAIALVFLMSSAVAAQQPPPPAQVERALQNPAVASQVRSRIASSGLSSDQIRARLKAAGYSESLLDPFMAGVPAADSSAVATDDVMRAVRFLGLVDAQDRLATDTSRGNSQTVLPPIRTESTEPRSRIYGLDVFRRSTSQFEPDLAGPVDATYRVGPRDVLAVILTGGVENSYSLEVTREGFVVIPQVGQIYVANMSLDQVTDAIFRRMRSVYSGLGRDPSSSTKLFVTVARLRTNQVFVIGEVRTPGSYNISSAGTMLTALYAAGGPSDYGNLRKVQLRRGGRVVSSMDLYAYLERGETSSDFRLETGDVLFVPVHGPRVEISGAVIRPAIYELVEGETLRQLIGLAGGFRAEAARKRVLVHRILPPAERLASGRERTVLDVASDDFAMSGGPALPLVDGDRVEVFEVADRVRNRIDVNGAVWQPGSQGYADGMKLSDALRQAGGVRPEVKDVLISRLLSDQRRIELRATFRDTLGTLVSDMALQEDDSIRVFATTDFRPDRYVVITGAVRNGARYPWREGMTLRDLVHYAGGLQDGAYLVEAEVARLPAHRQPGSLSTTLKVPLDSTYLLERDLAGRYVGPPGVPAPAANAPVVELQPYDNVLIFRQPDWELDRTVALTGEVKFPGEYVLRSKSERIVDVLERAGGLSEVAYPEGAVLKRTAFGVGRIGFDLGRALRDPTFRDNLILQPNDSLYIPPYRPVVDVRGAVHSPIAVAYKPGENIEYYINAAGGPTYNADPDRAYVQQPTGVVEPYKGRWLIIPDNKPEPIAGAIVIVPTEDPNRKKDWTGIVGSVAQVLASMVAIIAIARR